MKFSRLSPAASQLVSDLKQASDARLNRVGKTCAALRQLAATGEVAVISPIIGFLLDGDSTIAGATAEALQALFVHVSHAQLPAFDEWIRFSDVYYEPSFGDTRWYNLLPAQVNAFAGGDPATSALLLGLACSHHNGYVRQNAIACLDQKVHSGDEIPFLLLRLGDWVYAVRSQAEAAIARRLDASHRENYLACLPLVARLRERKRLLTPWSPRQKIDARRGGKEGQPSSPLFSQVEALLLMDLPSLLSTALNATDRVTRRFGLTLTWNAASEADPEEAQWIVRQALQTRDQMVHVQIARWLTAKEADSELQRRFMERLLGDRLPAVRRLALGWCALHQPAACKNALLDRSRSVRAIAQFYSAKLESLDLRGFYLETISRKDPRSLPAALGGLAETGKAEDADEIVPLVQSPRIAVRKAALATVAKLAGATGEHLPLFVEALQGDNPGCSRQARLALENHAQEIGKDRLKTLFFNVTASHVRRQTLQLINRLQKWTRLTLLIEIAGQQQFDEPLRQSARKLVALWFADYNRTYFAKPSPAELVALKAALYAFPGTLEPQLRQELQELIASFE